MKRIVLAIAALLFLTGAASAQSACSSIVYGAVLTAGQWNACFQEKQDALGYVPLNKAGDTMLGRLVTLPPATIAGFNIPPGTTPTTLADGDIWVTPSGMFVRVAGVTRGLLYTAFPSGNLLANSGASTADPASTTPTAWLDRWCSSSNDTFVYRTGGAWGCTGAFGTAHSWTGAQTFSSTFTAAQQVVYSGSVRATISADQNDWTPTGTGTYSQSAVVIVDGGAADRNITGMTGGADGRVLWVTNIGSTNSITLKNNSGSSSAANRFALPSDAVVSPGSSLSLRYDGTSSLWRPSSTPPTGLTSAIANNTVVGNNSGGSGPPIALTADQAATVLRTGTAALSVQQTKYVTFNTSLVGPGATQTVTGCGFQPSTLRILGFINATNSYSNGFADSGGTGATITFYGSGLATGAAVPFQIFLADGSGANFISGTVSYTSDGFIITWTRSGVPTGTATWSVLCGR